MKFLSILFTAAFLSGSVGCSDDSSPVSAPAQVCEHPSKKGDPDQYFGPKARGGKHASVSVPVASINSVDGVISLSDSLFSANPDAPVVLINTFGVKGYGDPCFVVANTDGSNLANGPDSDPVGGGSASTSVCALASVYIPQASNNVTIHSDSGFEYRVEIVFNPDYALSYQSLPRYEVRFLPL